MNNFLSKIVMICPECNKSISFNVGRLDNQMFPDAQFIKCPGCEKVYEFHLKDVSNASKQSAQVEVAPDRL